MPRDKNSSGPPACILIPFKSSFIGRLCFLPLCFTPPIGKACFPGLCTILFSSGYLMSWPPRPLRLLFNIFHFFFFLMFTSPISPGGILRESFWFDASLVIHQFVPPGICVGLRQTFFPNPVGSFKEPSPFFHTYRCFPCTGR